MLCVDCIVVTERSDLLNDRIFRKYYCVVARFIREIGLGLDEIDRRGTVVQCFTVYMVVVGSLWVIV